MNIYTDTHEYTPIYLYAIIYYSPHNTLPPTTEYNYVLLHFRV